jgi:hypothetical protein
VAPGLAGCRAAGVPGTRCDRAAWRVYAVSDSSLARWGYDAAPRNSTGSAPIAEPVFLGGDELRAELVNSVKRYKSMRQFALAHGISPAIVSLTIAGKREPDRAVAAALGFVVHTSFIRIMENRNV